MLSAGTTGRITMRGAKSFPKSEIVPRRVPHPRGAVGATAEFAAPDCEERHADRKSRAGPATSRHTATAISHLLRIAVEQKTAVPLRWGCMQRDPRRDCIEAAEDSRRRDCKHAPHPPFESTSEISENGRSGATPCSSS